MSKSIAPLIPIAQQGIPFTAADGQAFVRLPVPSGGFFILPVRSPSYRHWFFYQFFARYATVPTSNAFHAILNHLEAQAAENEDHQRLAVFRRVGSRGPGLLPHQILLDLAGPDRRFVEISPGSWRITAGGNALLQTSRSTVSLPEPVSVLPDPTPALEALRACLNLPSRADWLRCLAWLLAAFRPYGPFPFLILQGPPGSGKTFAARLLRSLIDPCAAPLFPTPNSLPEILSLARHNWILAFDHISALSAPVTDALCRLSSGLGVSVRDTARATPEPLLQSYKRPVILTVTDRWSCPPDLADRALTVTCPPLAPACRRTETDLLSAFNDAWPAILAALCSAVATALDRQRGERSEPSSPQPPTPNPQPLVFQPPSFRSADALAWAIAASPALGCTDREMGEAFAPLPPPHPMVEAVRALIEQRRRWTGTATELFNLLGPALSCTPRVVSHQLRTCMLTLADSGIELNFRRLPGGARVIDLREEGCDANPSNPPCFASQNSAPSPQS